MEKNTTLLPVEPDADGIATVDHDLNTMDVIVTCLTADGTRVGYRGAFSVTENSVEVMTEPGTGVTHVVIERHE
jgi:hypothetical protein